MPREPSQFYRQLENEVDWVAKGAVTPVGDQGACASGWAFAAASALSSGYFIRKGELIPLSEQQFLDCAGAEYNNNGCNGGRPAGALQYASKEKIVPQNDYNYTGVVGNCSYNTS